MVSSLKVVSCTVCVELLENLVTSRLTLMIQSNVPVVKGCLETVASATGIVNLTRRYADEYEGDSQLKVLIDNGEEVTAKTVFDLAKEVTLLL